MKFMPAQKMASLTFLLVVLGLFVYAAVAIRQFLQDEQRSSVQTVQFTGDIGFVDTQALEAAIKRVQTGSFFELDVSEVHKFVESQPWIYRASVRKQWPLTLQIYLVEQQPVAGWNADMLLNPYGEAFNVIPGTLDLPQLFGPGGSEVTALEGYTAMQQLLSTSDLHIKELSLSERFAWHIQLHNGIRLNLGRQQFMDRLQRFVDVYPLLTEQDKQIDYVDLRYDTGLAVGWLQTNKNKENKTDV